MGYVAYGREILFQRILQHHDVAGAYGAAFLDDSGQVADKVLQAAVGHGLPDAEVAVAQAGHYGLDVGAGLVAGTQRAFIVACEIAVHFFLSLLTSRFMVPFLH